MNRVEGEAARNALTLSVTAQTRRGAPNPQTPIDSVKQQLRLLAIPRAVERRIKSFRVHRARCLRGANREHFGPHDLGKERPLQPSPRIHRKIASSLHVRAEIRC